MSHGQLKMDQKGYGLGTVALEELNGMLKLSPVENRANPRAPSHDVYFKSDEKSAPVCLGIAWVHENKDTTGQTVVMQLDKPSWPKPLWLKGFQLREANGTMIAGNFKLQWRRDFDPALEAA